MHDAIGRFFRSYYAHCMEPSADTLFNFLNTLHSLNDRLRKQAGLNFFDCPEFLALKALRNFFHHEAELPSKITVVPLAIGTADLLFMCLTPSKHVDQACAKLPARDVEAIKSAIRFYGLVADLNPCIFNCAVKVFEKIEARALGPQDEPTYAEFKASYERESQDGSPHLIKGELRVHATQVPALLAAIQEASQGSASTTR
jgi:hypothetical protein